MAYVFTPEIEAILARGPPAIDWDGISDQLRRDFLQVCDTNGERVVPGAPGVYGHGGGSSALREEVVAQASDCRAWSCLEGRNCTGGAVAVAPCIRVGTGVLEDLVAVGKPWLTFSRASVAELHRMGVDDAYSVHGTSGHAVSGAVVYRGSTDSASHVDYLTREMFSRLAGTYKYVSAWEDDTSRFFSITAHLFGNGGRVCGWSTSGATCYWCEDSGRVVHEYESYDSGSVAKGAYCLCSKGDWLEVRDDENGERAFGGPDAHLMGWPSGAITPRVRTPPVVSLNDRFGGSDASGVGELVASVQSTGLTADEEYNSAGPTPMWSDVLVKSEEAKADGLDVVSSGSSDCGSEGFGPGASKSDEFDVMWDAFLAACVSPVLSDLFGSDAHLTDGLASLLTWTSYDMWEPGDEYALQPPSSAWMADGWCYLMVIVPRWRDVAASKHQQWITAEGFLSLPPHWVSFRAMAGAVCTVVGEGRLHISYGSVGLGCVPLFDELAGLVVKTRCGRDGGTFGGLLEEAFPGSIFGGGVVTMCAHYVLGTRKSEGPVATVLRQRVEEAVAAAPLPDGPALGGARPAHEREVVGDLSRWGTRLASDRYRPFALFPVPVEAGSGVYLPGVMWFDPMLPPDAAAVFPLSALPGWPVAPRAAVDRWYTRAELRSAESWKRLPGLLRNALAGVAPHPKPVFPGLGVDWATGGMGEHFSLLAGAWCGLYGSAEPVPAWWFSEGEGPLALEPISGGLYGSFPGIYGSAEPLCYVPPVHTWSCSGRVPIRDLALQWRRDHLK